MEELFPLSFKKKSPAPSRGLSSKQAESTPDLVNHYINPRDVPDRDTKHILTIIYDLDQTLISADGMDDEDEDHEDTELVIRPHAFDLLNVISRNKDVEFIVWTAACEPHAKRVIHSLRDIHFDYIVTRDRCWYDKKNPMKDLNLICRGSRSLETSILIDDRMDNGVKHPENVLIVPPYYPKDRSHDTTMLYLANILHRAINGYRRDRRESKRDLVPSSPPLKRPEPLKRIEPLKRPEPFHSYLFSPLVNKCVYEGKFYYGVRCFVSKEELEDRIRDFKKYVV